jgi:hypothetical protein
VLDFAFNIPPGDLDYDVETFPNVFTVYFEHVENGRNWFFEISPWRNDLAKLIDFIDACIEHKGAVRWVGYNSLGFDYPVTHYIYRQRGFTDAADIYAKAMEIINTPWERRFDHVIWESDHIVPQIDLMKVHHFDNAAKATSLKVLEFNMRAHNLMDLPFPVGTELDREQCRTLGVYNINDVRETKRFHIFSLGAISMREQLSRKFDMPVLNCSDVKIGEKILVKALEDRGVKCHAWVDGRKKKLQTHRDKIYPRDILLPCIQFEDLEFNRIHNELLNKEIPAHTTKGVFDNLVANVQGVEYKFGTGGLHGSVENRIVRSTETHQLVDVDVASYYPNLAIVNGFYPEHLGEEFCEAYLDIYRTRKTYPKGTPENESYKLALNGSFGNSNNAYSVLYDPQYTMSITLNGQLLLAMLVEALIKAPGLQMVQANTDGVTYLCPREHLDWTRSVIDWWQGMTGLELEENFYQSMFIRDVNSYIAVKDDGKIKRIGAYAYETAADNPGTRELQWHKDWSARIVQMAAEAYLVHGTPIRRFIMGHGDMYDFFCRERAKGQAKLELDGRPLQDTIRYLISNKGGRLEKVFPPSGPEGQFKKANGVPQRLYDQWHADNGNVHNPDLHTKNESTYEQRRVGVNTGWNVTLVNEWDDAEWEQAEASGAEHGLDINYEYYIKKAEDLVNLQEMN